MVLQQKKEEEDDEKDGGMLKELDKISWHF